MSQVYAAIMAGGSGTRFWPWSRKVLPKQFLPLGTDDKSLIRSTVDRISSFCSLENTWVLTNEVYRALVGEQVPGARVICEPAARNTAAPIGVAAACALQEDPDAVLLVLPSDHIVTHEAPFRAMLQEAVTVAKDHELLVTLGIEPAQPHTGYGYIKIGEQLKEHVARVDRFVEKPDKATADGYLREGGYYWNSGMFIWKARTIRDAIERHMPKLHAALAKFEESLGTADEAAAMGNMFEHIDSVSIDYGVLEHADNCAVVIDQGIGWSDVGTWDSWAQQFASDASGNVISGDVLTFEASGCTVRSQGIATVVVGASDLVVVSTPDAVLVCPKDKLDSVKQVVPSLKKLRREDLV